MNDRHSGPYCLSTRRRPAEGQHHTNNLDFLRIVAALFVILGHQYVLFGLDAPKGFGSGIHTLGVKIFFALSGYLVAKSWDADPHALRFARRRALRILPALFVLVIITTVLFGPILTDLDISAYFANPLTLSYLTNAALYIQYALPGVFAGNVLPAVNGSLWSLPVEAIMYLLVCFFGVLVSRPGRQIVFWISVLLAFVFGKFYFTVMHDGQSLIFYRTSVVHIFNMSVYFFSGALLWKLRSVHLIRPELGIAAVFALATLDKWSLSLVEGFLFTYAVLAFGLANLWPLNAAGKYGDFSYGLYLYAFPAQQATYQWFGLRFGFLLPLLIASVITLICAALSWHLVEKRALAFKPARRSDQEPAGPSQVVSEASAGL